MKIAKKKVLIVVTNQTMYPKKRKPTGYWLGEVTHFYDVIVNSGYMVDFLSPRGGKTQVDPASLKLKDPVNKKYYDDATFMDRLANTLRPDQVNVEDYAAIYFSGGHGTMWDFPDNEDLQQISREIYERGGVVSAVCHGVSGLLNVTDKAGNSLVLHLKLTGFSNLEERLIRLSKEVPFLLQSELKKRGVRYTKALLPFRPYAVVSGRVVTGQNPVSTKKVAQRVIDLLGALTAESSAEAAAIGPDGSPRFGGGKIAKLVKKTREAGMCRLGDEFPFS